LLEVNILLLRVGLFAFTGQNINKNKMTRKPSVSFEEASKLLKDIYGIADAQSFKEFVSYDDQNIYFCDKSGKEFILKITNSEDSKESEIYLVMKMTHSYYAESY